MVTHHRRDTLGLSIPTVSVGFISLFLCLWIMYEAPKAILNFRHKKDSNVHFASFKLPLINLAILFVAFHDFLFTIFVIVNWFQFLRHDWHYGKKSCIALAVYGEIAASTQPFLHILMGVLLILFMYFPYNKVESWKKWFGVMYVLVWIYGIVHTVIISFFHLLGKHHNFPNGDFKHTKDWQCWVKHGNKKYYAEGFVMTPIMISFLVSVSGLILHGVNKYRKFARGIDLITRIIEIHKKMPYSLVLTHHLLLASSGIIDGIAWAIKRPKSDNYYRKSTGSSIDSSVFVINEE